MGIIYSTDKPKVMKFDTVDALTKDQALKALINHTNNLHAIVSACQVKFCEQKFGTKTYDVIFTPQCIQPDEDFFSKHGNSEKPVALCYYKGAFLSLEDAIKDLVEQEKHINPRSSLLKQLKNIECHLSDHLTFLSETIDIVLEQSPKHIKQVPSTYSKHIMEREKSAFLQFVMESGMENDVCKRSAPNQCGNNVVGFVTIRDLGLCLQKLRGCALNLDV
ncbi:uncharacterized protein LOC130641917 isoform X2 [Hydractinia symbiolongicarpus]|nr:uncharacterized protein LOC130641917 isoform X2 [Hydractinia symbiolongicarpus]